MVRKLVLSLIAVLGICAMALAQNRQVSGTVTGADGAAVAGATVLVEGTHQGTTTGTDGKFAVNAPVNGSLVVSFIGYESQTVAIAGKTRLNIELKENLHAIDDVVVVAFGTAKKEAFTGSIAVVKSEDLEKRQTTNVLNALVGSVAGLQMHGSTGAPGTSGSINIRGISSMEAGTDPLVIVDGAPFSASLSNIPQADIESVSILKDAASAALYGARGASGVIIVTTKKGKSKDATINVDMKWGVNSKALQEYDVITNPGAYYEAYYSQLYNNYYYGQGMAAADANVKANTDMLSQLQYNVFTYPSNEQMIGTDGKLNKNATLGRKYTYNGTDYWLQPDNWTDEAYRNSLRQEYNVSLNGATDRASYYMSMGYLDDEGIISRSSYERISARIKADYQARKWLKVGANVGYVNSKISQQATQSTEGNSSSLFAFTSQVAPIYPVYLRTLDANGKPQILRDSRGNKLYDYSAGEYSYGNLVRPFLSTGNPLGNSNYDDYGSSGGQLNGTFFADGNITPWLKYNVTSTLTWGNSATSELANMYYGNAAATKGAITKTNTNALRTNNVQTLTFAKTYGRHDVTAMAGHEYYRTKTTYLAAKSTGLFSQDIPEIGATAMKGSASASSYTSQYNVEGWFLSGQYNFDTKYYFSVSYRRDASSIFAKDHRWGNFWSVGGAWIISKENFMTGTNKWLDMLKLKASIGSQGNDNIIGFAYTDTYTLSKNTDTSMSATLRLKGNPDITWETTTNFNVGLEFSLWQGRLTGSADFYSKKTTDLLFWVSIPESSGTRGQYANIGDIRNSGIEINLRGQLVRTKMVDWSISANIAHNKTKVLSLPASKIDNDLKGYQDTSDNQMLYYWYREGGSMYNFYMPHYMGVTEQGEALYKKTIWETDADGNYVTDKSGKRKVKEYTTTTDFSDATYYEQGSTLPDVFGGFGTNLRVGNFDLGVTFDYQIGGQVFDLYYASLMSPNETAGGAGTAIHKDYVKSWSPNNTSSNIPRWQFGDKYTASRSDRFLTSASYLNFQSFTVGYTIPSKLMKNKVKIRVYAAGENLFFWSARKGLDPRYAFEGNTSVLAYSPVRTISGGVQLTF